MKSRITSWFMFVSIFFSYAYLYAQVPLEPTSPMYVYLIRGIGRESGHWGPEFGERLKEQYPQVQLVFMDLPGSGLFHKQKALKNIPKTTRFLRNEYGHHLEKEGLHILLATSLAGMLGIDWMIQYPDDFDGLMLISVTTKNICEPSERVQPAAKKKFVQIFLTKDIRRREKRFLEINSNFFVDNDSILDSWVAIQQERPISQRNLLWQTIAGKRYRLKGEIPKVPILLVGSYGDQIVAPSCLRKLQEHLNAELAMHSSSGHGIPIDDPKWLANAMLEWIYLSILDTDIHDPGITVDF